MSRGRPETPPSYIINLNDIMDKVLRKIKETAVDFLYDRLDVDIVIPIWESIPDERAKYATFILNNGIYATNKSRFVEYLEGRVDKHRFYIYDKFKADGYSHKNSYKQMLYEVPYVDDTAEPIYIPVYWRVN